MWALWCEKTSQAALNLRNILTAIGPARSPYHPSSCHHHLTYPALLLLLISVNQSFMKSQGDKDSVVLVTIATQQLPGHRAQKSTEPIACAAENKDKVWEEGNRRLEGGSRVQGHTPAVAAHTHFNLITPFKVASLQIKLIYVAERLNIFEQIHSSCK